MSSRALRLDMPLLLFVLLGCLGTCRTTESGAHASATEREHRGRENATGGRRRRRGGTVQPWRDVQQRTRRSAGPRASPRLVAQGSRPGGRGGSAQPRRVVQQRTRDSAGRRASGRVVAQGSGPRVGRSPVQPRVVVRHRPRGGTGLRSSGRVVSKGSRPGDAEAMFSLGGMYDADKVFRETPRKATSGAPWLPRAPRQRSRRNTETLATRWRWG
jgi:hypothetical protein